MKYFLKPTAFKTTYCYQKSLSIPAWGIFFFSLRDSLKFTKVLTCWKKLNNWKGVLPRVLCLSMIKHQRWANLPNRQDTETKVIQFLLIKPRKNCSCFVSLDKMLTKFWGENIFQMPLWMNVGSFPLYTHFSKLELCAHDPDLTLCRKGKLENCRCSTHLTGTLLPASGCIAHDLLNKRRDPQELCPCKVASVSPCDPVDYSWPDSSVHGILRPRLLEWVAIPTSRGAPWLRDWTRVSSLLH